jgi:hypothetical protein
MIFHCTCRCDDEICAFYDIEAFNHPVYNMCTFFLFLIHTDIYGLYIYIFSHGWVDYQKK